MRRPPTRTPRKKGELPDEETTALDQLPGLLTRYSDGTFLKGKLNRIPDKPPRRPAYLDTIEPITSDLIDDVKEQFGGGTYRMYVHAGPKYVDTLNFTIEGKPKQLADDAPAPAPATPPRDAVQIAKDITLIATPILGAISAFITSMRDTRPAAGAQDPVQLLTLMQASEERGREQGRRLGRLEGGAGAGNEESVLGFAKQVVPPFLSMLGDNMKRRNGTAPAPVAPVVHQDNPTTAVAVVDTPPPPPPTMPALAPGYEFLSELRPFYRQLAIQAEADNDPDVIADFLWSQLDDSQQDALTAAVARDDFLPTIRAELAPIHARYADWLTHFLARLVETANVEPDAPAPAKPKRGPKK